MYFFKCKIKTTTADMVSVILVSVYIFIHTYSINVYKYIVSSCVVATTVFIRSQYSIIINHQLQYNSIRTTKQIHINYSARLELTFHNKDRRVEKKNKNFCG